MSTPATIFIKKRVFLNEGNPNNGIHYLQLYHHFDGYVGGVGIDLLRRLFTLTDEFTPDRIETITEVESVIKQVLPLSYEMIGEIEKIKYDCDYVYFIDFTSGIKLEVMVFNHDDVENYPDTVPLLEKRTKLLLARWAIVRGWRNKKFYEIQEIHFDNLVF